MAVPDIQYRHLIIGGTIKAATSSVFGYLSAHPDVCGSSIKETFFFTRRYSGHLDQDRKRYRRYFVPDPTHKVLVEASPNYLGYKVNVAPSINTLLRDVQLLFILRDPVDRLYSYYNFAVGKLQLSDRLSFEDYVNLCEKYASGKLSPQAAGIREKHLKALEIGAYARYLKNYTAVFPAPYIKVAFFEQLKSDPLQFMMDVSRFAGIDPVFYQNYAFNKANVTYFARVKALHLVALGLNRALESVLRQRPGLKVRLVGLYKRLNQERAGYVPMADEIRARLASYYAPGNRELKALLSDQELPSWLR